MEQHRLTTGYASLGSTCLVRLRWRRCSRFFVDHALIPDPISVLIPELIPLSAELERRSSAAGCAGSDEDLHPTRMQGTPTISKATSDFPPTPQRSK